ncbi:hypothetical protein ACFSKY_22830 [Azotobacter chroococcum]|uniref:Uncharacterized protein n=2 Tax=Azotobacter chroococcum TaxID=353 RepID=A0A4R1PG67_9GAMM|nr:hypothetical protein [Azotobacter chroococcum]TBV95277.1 hypothetical protein E0E53_12970 [Azotobacter chroococcum]TCL22097.1 hypothetical protein EV691_13546 [Azotobacter chroococcum]
MASLALRDQRAFSAAQHAWDNLEPPAQPDSWIETEQGQSWLGESISALILGRDVVITARPRLVVSAADFITTFGESAADIYAYDPKNSLEWALARGLLFGGQEYQDLARQIAKKMLLKHQDAAEKAHAWLEDY